MATVFRAPLKFPPQGKPWRAATTAVASLLTTTLAAGAAQAPFVAGPFDSVSRRPAVFAPAPDRNALLLNARPELRVLPDLQVQPKRAVFADPSQSQLLTLLAAQAPFTPQPFAAQLQRLALQPASAPNYPLAVPARAEPFLPPAFDHPQQRRTENLDTSHSPAPWTIPIEAAPFRPPSFESVSRRREISFDSSTGPGALHTPARAEPFIPWLFESVQRPRTANLDTSQPSNLRTIPAESPPFFSQPFERVYRQRTSLPDTSQGTSPLFNPGPARPFFVASFDRPAHKPAVIDYSVGSAQPFLPPVAAPFLPVDVQRPLARAQVTFELPPNLQPLFALAPAPFSPQGWTAPIERRLRVGGSLAFPNWLGYLPPPSTASGGFIIVGPRQKRIIVEARDKTVEVAASVRRIVVRKS